MENSFAFDTSDKNIECFIMITPQDLLSISVGDIIEYGPWLETITDEHLSLEVTKVEFGPDGQAVIFKARYFGVFLCDLGVFVSDDMSMLWSKL